jgi:proteasome lid subunit RPN8/RPN11
MWKLASVSVLPLIATAFLLAACSPDERESSESTDDVPGTQSPSASEDNQVSLTSGEDGSCDPSVVDIDHESNTPHLTYNGSPGDKVTVRYVLKDGQDEVADLELDKSATSVSTSPEIYNGDIDRIDIEAMRDTGESGKCYIEVA